MNQGQTFRRRDKNLPNQHNLLINILFFLSLNIDLAHNNNNNGSGGGNQHSSEQNDVMKEKKKSEHFALGRPRHSTTHTHTQQHPLEMIFIYIS